MQGRSGLTPTGDLEFLKACVNVLEEIRLAVRGITNPPPPKVARIMQTKLRLCFLEAPGIRKAHENSGCP